MKIGTPLSPSATRVMLLGSGELGKEVIIALQRLGVEVIAVDRYAECARPSGGASRPRHQHDRRRRAARAGRAGKAAPDRARDRSHRHRHAGGDRARWPGRGHSHRARRAAHHEPRRHPPPGCRNAGTADLALCIRRQPGRAAGGDRWRHRLSLHRQAGDVLLRQGPIHGWMARPM